LSRKVTLQDIAKKLGISATTVSLALRGHPRISGATKDRVRKLIGELKYRPDQVARALVVGQSRLIGVIVPNTRDPFYAEIFKGIEDSATAGDYHVLLSNGSYDLDGYASRVAELMSLRVAGIIAAPPFVSERPRLPKFWQGLRETGFPLILLNRLLKPALFHQVSADYASGVAMVSEVLASMGHKRVAYISGEPVLLPIRQRLTAFRRYSKKYGFDNDPLLLQSSLLTSRGGYEACQRLWTSVRKKPTAIVALSDTVAVGILRYLQEQSIAVPDAVSIVSFDGTTITEFTTPSLSTVVTPMYDVGKQAFELLHGTIEGKYGVPQNLLLPVRLELRESLAPAAGAERRVA
jgi:LacI family transcriptional regulator